MSEGKYMRLYRKGVITWRDLQELALDDIDARLSALESAQAKPDETASAGYRTASVRALCSYYATTIDEQDAKSADAIVMELERRIAQAKPTPEPNVNGMPSSSLVAHALYYYVPDYALKREGLLYPATPAQVREAAVRLGLLDTIRLREQLVNLILWLEDIVKRPEQRLDTKSIISAIKSARATWTEYDESAAKAEAEK